MTRRHSALVLLLVAATLGVALVVFVLGDGPTGADDSARREIAAVDRSDGPKTAADLETVDTEDSEGRERATVANPSKIRGNATSARPKRVAPDGPYRGRVLDNLGRPLENVALELQPWEEANEISFRQFGQPTPTKLEVTTDADGRFLIERTKPLGRTVGIKAMARGFLNAPMKHVFDAEAGSDFGDIFLEPGVIVEGWVRDTNGSPIAGARVRRIERDGDAMVDMLDQIGFSSMLELATTDAEGRFELPHEKEGAIVLLAEHDDIMPARFEGPSKRGGEVLQDIVITARRAGRIEGTISGYPKGRIRGVVAAAAIDPAEDTMAKKGMSAVMSAQLSPAGEHTGKVAGDGTFVIGGLTPGIRYELRGVERRRFVETVPFTNAVEAAADGSHVTLEFDGGAQASFRVVDRATREPIEKLEIGARWGERPAKVMLTPDGVKIPKRFPDGKVTLHELRPADDPSQLRISVDAPGYLRTKTEPIAVGKGGRADGGVVELDLAPRFRFLVIDAATREPVRRARVTLSPVGVSLEPEAAAQRMITGEIPPREWAKTGRDGRCELPGIRVDNAMLEVSARGYADYVVNGFDMETPRDEILIQISRGGAIEIVVVDAGGTLVEGVRAECRTRGEDSTWTSGKLTDQAGEALFEALTVGEYEVRALRSTVPAFGRPRGNDDDDDDWMEVEVVRDHKARIEYVLPAVGGLRGVVTMAGDPAVGARVSVVKEERADEVERFIAVQDQFAGFGNQREGDTTGADGHFELSDIEVGRYVVMVRHPEVAMVTRAPVDIGTDVSSLDIEIVLTTIQGHIVDDEGEPVVGAEISVRRATAGGDDDVRLTRSFLGMSNYTTTTDASGLYRVVGVKAAAPLQVVVRADGFTDAVSESVTVAERETREVKTIEIERAGSILVTIVGEELDTQVLFVTAKPADESTVAADKIELVRAGRARIGGLKAGRWTLRTRGGRRRAGEVATEGEPRVVEVRPGETVEVELER